MPSRARSVSGGRSSPAWPSMSAVSELMPPECDTTAMPGFCGLRDVGEQLRDLQQLVVVLHADDAVLLEHGVVQRIGAGQRGGVRARRLRAGFGAPDLDEHDGLAALGRELGHRDELARRS